MPASKATIALRKAEGICVRCGVNSASAGIACQSCADKQAKTSKIRREARKQIGKCPMCENTVAPGYIKCQGCIDKEKLRVQQKQVEGKCGCGNPLKSKWLCEDCLDIQDLASILRRLALKFEVFEAYGGAFCKCCNEAVVEFLSIDHINNDGSEHRKIIGAQTDKDRCISITVYRWLRDNNYPPGFQVLCFNCNNGKYTNHGVCPHQEDNQCITKRSEYNQRLKSQIMAHYGNDCQCCGIDNIKFLTIDHIDGGGTKDRELAGGGTAYYQSLRTNNYPAGLQTMCYNCNCGRNINGGICPHQMAKV